VKVLAHIKLELFLLCCKDLKIMNLLTVLGMQFQVFLKVLLMLIFYLFILPKIKVILIKQSSIFKIFGPKLDLKRFTKTFNLEPCRD
jgi:hypothetical protein